MKLDDIFLYERRNFLLEQMFQLLRVEVSADSIRIIAPTIVVSRFASP